MLSISDVFFNKVIDYLKIQNLDYITPDSNVNRAMHF